MDDKPQRANLKWLTELPGRVSRAARSGGLESVVLRTARVAAEEAAGLLDQVAAQLAHRTDEAELSPMQLAALAENAGLRGKHAGQRAFVFGNGPSLKSQDLTPLAGELTFVGNSFWRHPVLERSGWNPTYYTFVDRRFFDGDAITDDFFENVRERCDDTTYLIRTRHMDIVRDRDLLWDAPIIPIETGGSMSDEGLDDIDLTQMLPAVESVLLVELMAAIYMGCSPIYLLGADHDWLASMGQTTHFHDEKTIAHADDAATSPIRSEYRPMLEFCWRLWRNHEMIRDIAIRHGVEIYNATAGGALDVYPRVALETVVEDR